MSETRHGLIVQESGNRMMVSTGGLYVTYRDGSVYIDVDYKCPGSVCEGEASASLSIEQWDDIVSVIAKARAEVES